jgi:hypothetical protein
MVHLDAGPAPRAAVASSNDEGAQMTGRLVEVQSYMLDFQANAHPDAGFF